jgi:ABC-type hemin transport system ATPase subunit
MDLVFRFADRISVLVSGAILVDDVPGKIANDPQVRQIYLGEPGGVGSPQAGTSVEEATEHTHG